MLRPIIALAAAIILTGPAFAGDITTPEPEPVASAALPTPTYRPASDWSGFYLGAQTGYADIDDTGFSTSGPVYGVHAGYLHDFGGLVAGAELRYDDLSALRGVSDRVTMLTGEFRLGYDLGRVLPYVAVGGAQVTNHASNDSASGPVYGLGADFALTDQWRLGAEATHLDLDDDGPSGPFTGTSLGLSVSFSF